MYSYFCVPPLAPGHIPLNDAAGHQTVTPGHSAWARERDVTARSFLPSGGGFRCLNKPASFWTNAWKEWA